MLYYAKVTLSGPRASLNPLILRGISFEVPVFIMLAISHFGCKLFWFHRSSYVNALNLSAVLHHHGYQLPAFIENFHFTLELVWLFKISMRLAKCLAETDTSFKWRALFDKRLMVHVISEYFVLGCCKIVLIPYTVSLLKTLRKWLMDTRILTVTSFIPIKFLIKYTCVTLF